MRSPTPQQVSEDSELRGMHPQGHKRSLFLLKLRKEGGKKIQRGGSVAI